MGKNKCVKMMSLRRREVVDTENRSVAAEASVIVGIGTSAGG